MFGNERKLQNIAIVMSQSVAALVEVMGMAAENQYRDITGRGVAYGEEAFLKLMGKYGLRKEDVIATLENGVSDTKEHCKRKG